MTKYYSYLQRALLRALSEDSSASVADLSKKLKCARNTVWYNMLALEKDLGIRYTIEFSNDKLQARMHSHIWAVRFGVKPSAQALRKLFEEDAAVRFAAKTDGDFDLVLMMRAASDDDYAYWGFKTAYKLLNYNPTIEPSSVLLQQLGFVPMPNSVIEKLELSEPSLDELDRGVLMLLNENSRMSYREMAKRLKQKVETIRYRVKRLSKEGVIKRFTITLTKPPTDYNLFFFLNYDLSPGAFDRYREAHRHYVDIDGKAPVINTFQYLSILSGSSLVFGLGCFDTEEKAIRESVLAHKEIYKGDNARVRFAKITDVVKGYLPVRNIDVAREFHGIDFKRLKKELHD
ncbi:MAG: AsnC family transcriptional regulator [Candidatus Micrarchaeota archaeon]|nr:AsnC family transcriptional regulator [Candidatus Micrarchaeota archaeon]